MNMAQPLDHFGSILPQDQYNQELVNNVHPPQWPNPTPSGRYNLVIIGAGTAGLVTAAIASALGAKVALIERHLMGGDCLNVGCVPSKGVIRAARAWTAVKEAEQFGVHISGEVKRDFGAAMARMRKLRARISHVDSAHRYTKLGVDVFIGNGRFTSSSTIDVDGTTLQFTKAVICTGARATAPPIPGLANAAYLTNETIFSLTELPPRLGVIGAGPIGCELAQSFARFGSQVFLVEAMHGILPNEDRDAADIVEQSLLRDGVQLLCCGKELNIHSVNGGKHLRVDSHGSYYDIPVDEILVGVGRSPNIEGFGARDRWGRIRQNRCEGQPPASNQQSNNFCGRRYLLSLQIHSYGRCTSANRHPERPISSSVRPGLCQHGKSCHSLGDLYPAGNCPCRSV